MLRILCSAAIVAVAMADTELPGIYTTGGDLQIRAPGSAKFARLKEQVVTSEDIEQTNAQHKSEGEGFATDIGNLVESDAIITGGIQDAEAASANVAALNAKVTAVQKKSDDLVAQLASDVKTETDTLTAKLESAAERLIDDLEDKFASLRSTLAANKVALDARIKDELEDAEKVSADLQVTAGEILEQIQAHEDCMVDGWVYDEKSGKCFEVEQEASKLLGKVWHRMFNNEDGRENGYIDNRYIKFDKELDDTYLRVVYYENFRVHGHQTHGKWHVMFCDGDGNGCAECNEPGQIGMWKYAHHQGNWWMNDHIHGSVTGMCRRTDSAALKAGTYQIRILVDQARYDVHTGASGGNHLMVDEVVKY